MVLLPTRYLYAVMMTADRMLLLSRVLMDSANGSLVQYASTYMIAA